MYEDTSVRNGALPKPAGEKPSPLRINSKSDAACPPSRKGNSRTPVAMDTGSPGAAAGGGVLPTTVPQLGQGPASPALPPGLL